MKVKLLVLLLSMIIVYSSCNNKKAGEATKVVEGFAINVDTCYKMMIVAKLSVKADKISNFTETAREMIEKSNKEAGCTFYQLYQDPYESTKFVFVEEYKNQAAVDAHFATDYFAAFGGKIADFILAAPDIKIFSIANEATK